MSSNTKYVLTINSGSSSIKFAMFLIGEVEQRVLHGKIERIGLTGTKLVFHDLQKNQQDSCDINASDYKSVIKLFIQWLESYIGFDSLSAIGHRVVHGMKHTADALVTKALLDELYQIMPYDPEHLPSETHLIETLQKHYPDLPQVACFDTSFHQTMPQVAKLLSIPQRYQTKGIQRYGFHGISYAYLVEELARMGDSAATNGRVILAHLGSGTSMSAVLNGKSIDTSMGFTPTGGLLMGTRSGDLDPGLMSYLARTEHMTTAQFQHMTNYESGLLGVSGVSSDMRELLAHEESNIHAANAIELFCYQAKKQIGAFAASLGGLDTLVFAGGIGENVPPIRTRICNGLGFLGITLDQTRNSNNAKIISSDDATVKIWVIPTDEELMIARSVTQTLHLN
jgi:acetate kinase